MKRNWLIFLIYAGALLTVSSIPHLSVPGNSSDKAAHTVEYLIFAVLFWRALGDHPAKSCLERVTILVIAGCLFAAFDEIHQLWIPGRKCSLHDWYADVAGIFGIATFVLVRRGWKLQKYETV